MSSEQHYGQDKALQWRLYRSPARPSPTDLALYAAHIEPSGGFLLLGSTPELRSLARRHDKPLTAVDASVEAYRALEALVTVPGEERFVCSNWLEMDLGETFELVLGDGVINMLPPALHPALLERVAAHTRPGGLFILHAHAVTEPEMATPEEVIRWYRTSGMELYTATANHMCALWANPADGGVPTPDFLLRYRQLLVDGVIDPEEYRDVEAMLQGDALTLYLVDVDRVRALAGPFFELEAIHYSDDYGCPQAKPFLLLRRR